METECDFDSVAGPPELTADHVWSSGDACGQAPILKGWGGSGILRADGCQRSAAGWIRVDLRVDGAAVGPTDVNR